MSGKDTALLREHAEDLIENGESGGLLWLLLTSVWRGVWCGPSEPRLGHCYRMPVSCHALKVSHGQKVSYCHSPCANRVGDGAPTFRLSGTHQSFLFCCVFQDTQAREIQQTFEKVLSAIIDFIFILPPHSQEFVITSH